jgi:hypothetical protein
MKASGMSTGRVKPMRAPLEPVIPRRGSAQLLPGSSGITPPDVIKADHSPAQGARGAKHRVRDHRRKAHLQALDITAASSENGNRRESRDDAASVPLTAGVVDEQAVAEVDEDRDSRVRDEPKVDEVPGLTAESSHRDPRQPTGP